MSVPDFQKQVAELEFQISQLFDRKTIFRSIDIEGLHCTFRYSTDIDKVVVDFWPGPAPDDGRVHNPVKTMKLPVFIYNYCNPEGTYVLKRLILERT